MSSQIAIGIDLGTTYSCVAVCQHGKIEVITNEEGSRTTPSEVAFTDAERLVGESAKDQGARNPKNTVFDVKRLIGRKFDDPELQADIKNFPFSVLPKNSNPVIEVDFKNERTQFTPEQISSMVLQKMKYTAERYLGRSVTEAVITVPAYFNDGQRRATKDAATIAGLNAIRIINEPTAASFAYGFENKVNKNIKVLIFDFGGGTFDVSILSISRDSVYKVIATNGDTHLGGSDFDQRLLRHFATEFKRKHSIDISNNPRSIQRLRTACERLKRRLSVTTESTIEVDSLCDGIDFSSKITRARFEDLCADLFKKALGPVENALLDAKLDKSKIDEVVLVGGSTRIPKIQIMLKDFFDGKELSYTINPDEAVAYGAAALAAVLSGVRFNSIGQLHLSDVTPLSLGIQCREKRSGKLLLSKIVPRNTTVPAKFTKRYEVGCDETSVRIEIFEGEHDLPEENNKLGEFSLSGITPRPEGEAKIHVTFEIDTDGILTVSAVDLQNQNSESIVIKNESGRLLRADIDRMIEEAKRYEEEDRIRREIAFARHHLEEYLYQIKDAFDNYGSTLLSNVKEEVLRTVDNTLDWLNGSVEKEAIETKFIDVKSLCDPIMSAFNDLSQI